MPLEAPGASGEEMTGSKEHWVVDKKIPLALMFALVMQTGAAVWYASKLESRITAVETTVTSDKLRLDASDRQGTETDKSVTRIEERQASAIATSQRIEAKLDKLVDQIMQVRKP